VRVLLDRLVSPGVGSCPEWARSELLSGWRLASATAVARTGRETDVQAAFTGLYDENLDSEPQRCSSGPRSRKNSLPIAWVPCAALWPPRGSEGFDFLGFHHRMVAHPNNRRYYLVAAYSGGCRAGARVPWAGRRLALRGGAGPLARQ
jgi:hypothetical protein